MPLSWNEIRQRAIPFSREWADEKWEEAESTKIIAKLAVDNHWAMLSFVVVVSMLTGCTPSLTSSNWEVRQKAVIRLTDQALLAKVAQDAKDEVVRQIALDKLKGMELSPAAK